MDFMRFSIFLDWQERTSIDPLASEGISPTEQIGGNGWGLLQVLEDMDPQKTLISAEKEFAVAARQTKLAAGLDLAGENLCGTLNIQQQMRFVLYKVSGPGRPGK
jgi:hypothetical protein